MKNTSFTQKNIDFGQYPIVVDIYSNPENTHSVILLAALGIAINKYAGYKIAFGNKETKSLMRDWSKVIFTGNYAHISGQENVVNNAALFVYLNGDDFAPMSSMLGLSGYFKNPQINTLDLTHKTKGNQHSAWIKQPDEVVEIIIEWIDGFTE
ncbi:hypothetical protein KTI63_01700 [Acinetobacter guillouiae]|uniref:hypothetical protein n=1 Tax=Acinetobacter guillouiae TaxID=106649 RepID=UPI0021D278B1|nr:hypothetical protein [Acinetobacter guillouiae]MCU4491177.1 hypothetical protein [Acinetobacter guillouiae]